MTTEAAVPPVVQQDLRQLGYNVSFAGTAELAVAKRGGARYMRFQPAWSNVENYSSPGTYSLGVQEAGLAYCGAHGLVPVAVCAYGPPWTTALTLTVSSAVPTGSHDIPVTGAVASVVTPLDHVMRQAGNLNITARDSYYGSLIDTTDSGAGTITLASETTVALNPGDVLVVRRLLYESPADNDPDNPSVVAYFNYLRYVAERIAANGASGYVTIWNEAPWPNDPWDSRHQFYDSVPPGMSTTGRMKSFLQHALGINDLPDGVRIINGATDKTGASGLNAQGLNPTPTQVADSVAMESIHPYHNLPEGAMWDQSSNNGTRYTLLNPTVDVGGNFTNLAYAQDSAGSGLGRIATECGTDLVDSTRQALYALRRVLTCWACDVIPVVYALAAAPYHVVNTPSFAPRAAYPALQRMMALVGQVTGVPAVTPTFSAYNGEWPAMVVRLFGADRSIVFVWQRTGHNSASPWKDWPTPAAGEATFTIGNLSVVDSVDLLTGAYVPVAPSNGTLTVPVGESPLALVFAEPGPSSSAAPLPREQWPPRAQRTFPRRKWFNRPSL